MQTLQPEVEQVPGKLTVPLPVNPPAQTTSEDKGLRGELMPTKDTHNFVFQASCERTTHGAELHLSAAHIWKC